jgi:hemoglobin/transferrin/lactoferrin receptor protein
MMYWRRFFPKALFQRALFFIGAILLCVSAVFAQNTKVISEQWVRVVNGSIPIPFAVCVNISSFTASMSDGEGLVLIPSRAVTDTLEFRSLGFDPRVILPGHIIGEVVFMNDNPVGIDAVLISSNISPDVARRSGLQGIEKLQLTAVNELVATGRTTDLLLNTGQVQIQQSQQGGGSPVIRGFEANRILLVVDGVRMNNAIYRSGHLQNAITVDASSLEQVQIIMGPSSVKYGSDALGGVIHFSTYRPRFRRDGADENWSAFASVNFTSNNNGTSFHTRAEGGGERWGSVFSFTNSTYGDLRMGENRMHGDSAWGLVPYYVQTIVGEDLLMSNPDPNVQINSGYSQKDFMHKFRFALPGGALETNVQYSISSDIPRFNKLTDLSPDGEGLKWAEWNYGPQKRLMTAVSWEQYLGLPGSLHTTLAYQNIEESRVKRQFGSEQRDEQVENLDVISLSSIWESSPYRGDGWGFEMGVDGQWNGLNSSVTIPNTVTRYPNNGSTMLNLGVFAAARRSKGLKVYHGGLRYSFSALDAYYDLSQSSFDLPFDEIHSKNGALTGNLAVEFPMGKRFTTHTSLSTGFRHPNIDDATKIREKGGYILIPNENLKPEYIYSLDENITWRPQNNDRNMSVTASAFISLWVDAITPHNTRLDGELTMEYDGEMVQFQMNQNIDNAVIGGLSVQANSAITESISMSGTVNYTKGTAILSQLPLSHIPPIFGKLSLTKRRKTSSIKTYVLFNSAKKYDDYGIGSTDNISEALSSGTPAWWTWNIESDFELSDKLHAQVGVHNILDIHYKPFSSGISSPGRGLFVSLHANF